MANKFRAIGWCIIMLMLIYGVYIAVFGYEKVRMLQDTVSNTVAMERVRFGVLKDTRILYYGANWKADSAHWKEGVKLAFSSPLAIGQHRIIDNGYRQIVFALISHTPNQAKVRWRYADGATWVTNEYFGGTIRAGDIQWDWSFKDNQSVYIYADRFFDKPTNSLYRLSALKADEVETVISSNRLSQLSWVTFPWEQFKP